MTLNFSSLVLPDQRDYHTPSPESASLESWAWEESPLAEPGSSSSHCPLKVRNREASGEVSRASRKLGEERHSYQRGHWCRSARRRRRRVEQPVERRVGVRRWRLSGDSRTFRTLGSCTETDPKRKNCTSCSSTTKCDTIAALIYEQPVCSVSVRDDFPQFATVIREHGHCGEDL